MQLPYHVSNLNIHSLCNLLFACCIKMVCSSFAHQVIFIISTVTYPSIFINNISDVTLWFACGSFAFLETLPPTLALLNPNHPSAPTANTILKLPSPATVLRVGYLWYLNKWHELPWNPQLVLWFVNLQLPHHKFSPQMQLLRHDFVRLLLECLANVWVRATCYDRRWFNIWYIIDWLERLKLSAHSKK